MTPEPRQVAICMGMDSMRICLGRPTKNYTEEQVVAWMIQIVHGAIERGAKP
jgi:hypothetical protein